MDITSVLNLLQTRFSFLKEWGFAEKFNGMKEYGPSVEYNLDNIILTIEYDFKEEELRVMKILLDKRDNPFKYIYLGDFKAVKVLAIDVDMNLLHRPRTNNELEYALQNWLYIFNLTKNEILNTL